MELNLVFFYRLSILCFEPWCALAGMLLVCIHLLDLVAGGDKTKWIIDKHDMAPHKQKRLRDRDQDTDTDSENKSCRNTSATWQRFLVVESVSVDLPLSKLSPFAIQKGFQAIAETFKSIKRLRDGSFLVECARKLQAMGLLKTTQFIDRPMRVSVHKALNSSRGVIRCWDLVDMLEVEIQDELKDQGVVGVNRVTLKKEGKVIFLMFGAPELSKEIMVSYLKVKVALFVPNLMHCFNCNKFGHTSQRCEVAVKCPDCGKDKHEGWCEGPKLCSNCNGPHTSSAKDCPVWQKEEIQRVHIEKYISFLETRQLVEAKMPTVVFGGKFYAAAASSRRKSKSVECQTSLNIHLGRLSLMCVLLVDPDRYWPALRLPLGSQGWYRPTSRFCASPLSVLQRQIGVQPIPPKQALVVPPITTKWHLRVQWLPPKAHQKQVP